MAEAGRVDLSSFIQNKFEMSIDMVPFSNVLWLSEEYCETKIIKVISALHICVTSSIFPFTDIFTEMNLSYVLASRIYQGIGALVYGKRWLGIKGRNHFQNIPFKD